MKKYICGICNTGFKTEGAKELHESIPIKKLGYDFSILKNKKKYFFLVNEHEVTRKHSELYSLTYFYKYLIENNNQDQFKIKKADFKITSSEIENKLNSGELKNLEKKEVEKLFAFLNKKYGSEGNFFQFL